ncbi:site-specific integrase [Burkholderia multivorans]|uniref:site-specific integrase n=2 Tax=Burkholderia multivorans TaxID=87883 RepID=UPI0031014471
MGARNMPPIHSQRKEAMRHPGREARQAAFGRMAGPTYRRGCSQYSDPGARRHIRRVPSRYRRVGRRSNPQPDQGTTPAQAPAPRDVRLAIGDDEKLIASAIDYNREIAPAIVLAIETAMRQGEIAKLRWEYIDLEDRTVLLPMTKNGTPRKVPLSSRAIEALTWCPPPHRGRVFKLTQSAMKYAFSRVREECGLGTLHFHDLRHEATSRLFEKGLNVLEVATITGHKNLKHLQRYTHLRAEDLAKKLG